MKEKKVFYYLTSAETDLVLRSLVDLRNSLIRQGRFPDCVDDIIEIICNAGFRKV